MRGIHVHILYRTAPTFLGNVCALSVYGLCQMYSFRNWAKAVNQVLAYSDTNLFLTPAP